MSKNPKNPYGLRPGDPTLVYVDDVERGLACNCICPGCGERLEARKGELISPYFAHAKGTDCEAGYQTALHLLAKDVLAEEKRILLPSLRVRASKEVWRSAKPPDWHYLVKSRTRLKLDEVVLEKKLGSIIPDVTVRVADRRLLVEITVAHGIDAAKRKKIAELGIGVVEFDFSGESRVVTRGDLKRVLIDTYGLPGRGMSHWIYHPHAAATIDRLNQEHIQAYPLPSDNLPTQQKPKVRQASMFD